MRFLPKTVQPQPSGGTILLPKCKDDFHNREKLEARREAKHDERRAAERAREDRINGTITLDLVDPLPEPPLTVKRRKILTVERADDQPRL